MKPSTLSLRRVEELTCRRRNEEAFKREQWRDVTAYFKTWERVGSQYSNWTCGSYYDQIQNLNKDLKKQSQHEQKLSERRERLTQLLLQEKIKYEVELKELSTRRKTTPPPSDISRLPTETLENVNIELYRRHQENLRRQAELKQHLAWKSNQPQLFELNRKLHNNFVQRSWVDQILDKQRQREEEEREKAGEELERLRQRQLEAEKARERRAKKREEMNQLKQDLEHQMDLLRKEQEKCDRLKLEEARQCQLEREVDEILVQRELELKRKRNREHGLFLTKQFHLKLKQATRLIQEDLKRDQVLLAEFTARILAETSLDETTRREARQEMDKANNILAQLMEREKARAREMDFVFHEDARRMWEKQECRWSAEQEARTRLLNEVLTGVRAQITANLAANLERQQELLSERERLLQGVEEAKTQWEAKQREIEEKEREWACEVEAQIIEKDLRKKEEELREAEERERERQKALEEERKLAAEMDKMRTSTFVPEYRPRKRIVW
uniref:Trichoplein keratin filament-binding protein n=1 Tax=Cacopsylla melanoneura TaxID=428564 RepID=A0A8D8VTY2_9HEMI